MAGQALVWDKAGEREYKTGVSKVAIYPQNAGGTYPKGAAWSGVTSISESPSGAEPSPLYADNIKYLNLMSVEEFGFSIEAYMYPDEFAACNGEKELQTGVKATQQDRVPFGLTYQTIVGNDTEGNTHGYEIHLVYGALAAPSEVAHNSVNDSPEAGTMSWTCTTTPVAVEGMKPTAHLIIDSKTADPTKLEAFEKIIYGSTEAEARLPLPDEVKTLLNKG